jgi:Ala-tRNA(Pro) deacylase
MKRMDKMVDIYRFLAENDIDYERCDHPPVFTCEEAERMVPPMAGAKTKNIFVRDKKGRRHFLVMVGYDKVVDLKALGSLLGAGPLSLASPRRLKALLDVDPGSVTVLALINDHNNAVEVLFDQALWESPAFRCHPLVNTSTLAISKADLRRFLDLTGHDARVVDIPAKP